MAASRQMPTVQQVFDAELARAVDADTLIVTLDKHHGDASTKRLRLLGVDAPEARTEAGRRAKAFAEAWLAEENAASYPLTVQTVKADSFGRWLAYVWRKSDGACLSSALVEAGHARAVSELAQIKEARDG